MRSRLSRQPHRGQCSLRASRAPWLSSRQPPSIKEVHSDRVRQGGCPSARKHEPALCRRSAFTALRASFWRTVPPAPNSEYTDETTARLTHTHRKPNTNDQVIIRRRIARRFCRLPFGTSRMSTESLRVIHAICYKHSCVRMRPGVCRAPHRRSHPAFPLCWSLDLSCASC